MTLLKAKGHVDCTVCNLWLIFVEKIYLLCSFDVLLASISSFYTNQS